MDSKKNPNNSKNQANEIRIKANVTAAWIIVLPAHAQYFAARSLRYLALIMFTHARVFTCWLFAGDGANRVSFLLTADEVILRKGLVQ